MLLARVATVRAAFLSAMLSTAAAGQPDTHKPLVVPDDRAVHVAVEMHPSPMADVADVEAESAQIALPPQEALPL